jgi:hypothetical protein
MSNLDYEIKQIGFEANRVLQRNDSVEVYGTSSKGIYLQTANDLTLYLSTEDHNGPLTINYEVGSEELFLVEPRTLAQISEENILFPEPGILLSLEKAKIWSPAPPPQFNGLEDDYLIMLFEQLKELGSENPFFPLIEMVLTSISVPLAGFPDFYKRMMFLKKSLKNDQASDLAWELENLLGVGPGLTPLGDDITLGVLLALNRGKKQFLPDSYLKDLNRTVIDLALDLTTRLSFSLLVCGADGSADQRLIKVLDSLLICEKIKDDDLKQMLAWGSTSGFAVLAGMLLALS